MIAGLVKRPGLGLWLGFVTLALTTLAVWTHHGWFPVTGDEPHYLVMADAIVHDQSFEQYAAYQREFDSRAIHAPGLAPPGATPDPTTTHAVEGPNGLYNVHNIGLPLVVSVPFLVAGSGGVKVFLVLATSLIVVLAWRWSALFTDSTRARVLAVAVVGSSAPFLAGGNQIYPDLLAGVIALYAYLRLFSLDRESSPGPWTDTRWAVLPVGVAVAFLPWLQIKFFATAAVLAGGLAVATYRTSRPRWQTAVYPALTGASGALLGAYNLWAFGYPSGPYADGALELSRYSLMVFLGLHLDRFQGILVQAPAFVLVAVFAVPFVRRYRLAGFVLVLTYASLIVPNAMHVNWYGGFSFAGRFAWSAAVTAVPLVVYGMIRIVEQAKAGTYLALAFLAVNASAYAAYTFEQFDFYDRSTRLRWLSTYPSLHEPIAGILPAFYDSRFAYDYPANALYVASVIGLAMLGWRYGDTRSDELLRALSVLAGVTTVLALGASLTTTHTEHAIVWYAPELPSQIGDLNGEVRWASELDGPGFLSFGPYVTLDEGSYRYTVNLIGNGEASGRVGHVDVVNTEVGAQLAVTPIETVNGEAAVAGTFAVSDDLSDSPVEIRTFFAGSGDLAIHSIELRPLER